MTATKFLKEVAREQHEEVAAFITCKPPHPAELSKTSDTLQVKPSKGSDYDNITLTRKRQVIGTNVTQETDAVGISITGPENQEKTALGSWDRDEFRLERTPEPAGMV